MEASGLPAATRFRAGPRRAGARPDPLRAVPGAAAHRRLSRPALALRVAHAAVAVAMLVAIAYVWWCALTGRRGPLLRIAVTSLLGEGAVIVANHGRCPLGPLQERLGDPVPLFELVLSPRAAHRAVPVLGGLAAVPMVVLAARRITAAISPSRPDPRLACVAAAWPRRRPSRARPAAGRC